MKGVILGINPTATLIDLTHQIPPQDIQTAGFQLASAYQYFPTGTIHLVVVDPGVGSQRQAIAVDLGTAQLVGPNNGVFSQVLSQISAQSAVCLDNSEYWLSELPSQTFHGRDIFAPVAAYLSKGMDIHQVGNPLDVKELVRLPSFPNGQSQRPEDGFIQAIDHFGNLITSIPGNLVHSAQDWGLYHHQQFIPGHRTYSDVSPGEATALVGSHGWVEIAVNQGRAQNLLRASLHDAVQLAITS